MNSSVNFPGFDRLFKLDGTSKGHPYRGTHDFEADSFDLFRGDVVPDQTISIRREDGAARPGHFFECSTLDFFVISGELADRLRDSGLTGWSPVAVEVFDRHGQFCGPYVGLSITGRVGYFDPALSDIVIRKYPGGHFPEFRGVQFDPASWEGADFAVPLPDREDRSGSAHAVVTERVVEVFHSMGVKECVFERLSEKVWRSGIFEIASPHLLPADYADRVGAAYRAAGVAPPADNRWGLDPADLTSAESNVPLDRRDPKATPLEPWDSDPVEDAFAALLRRAETEGYAALSEPEKLWCDAKSFVAEVDLGGLIGFFINPGANRLEETLSALEAIGANQARDEVLKICALFTGPVPSDIDERNDVITSWPDDGEQDRVLEAAEEELQTLLGDLEMRVDDFARREGVLDR